MKAARSAGGDEAAGSGFHLLLRPAWPLRGAEPDLRGDVVSLAVLRALPLSPTLPQLRDAASRGSSPVLTAPLCGSERDLCSDFTSVNPSPAVSPGSCSKTDWEGHAAGACVCVAWVGTCAPLSLRSGLTPIYSEVSMLIWQALVAFGKFAGEAALQETTQGWRVECTTWLPRRIHCSRVHCLVA